MNTVEIITQESLLDLNIHIEALDRLSKQLHSKLEEWEHSEHTDDYQWLHNRFLKINEEIAYLFTRKKEMGLPI
jgi:hypothetical protein